MLAPDQALHNTNQILLPLITVVGGPRKTFHSLLENFTRIKRAYSSGLLTVSESLDRE